MGVSNLKASELRVGNLVLKLYYLMGWQIGSVEAGELALETFSDLFQPIPLTEEWLLRFGFKHVYGEYYEIENQHQEFRIAKTVKGFSFAIGSEYFVGREFQYVHQLQNLYFALTGEELEIK